MKSTWNWLSNLARACRENPAKTALTGLLALMEAGAVVGWFYVKSLDYVYVVLLFSAILFIFYAGAIETLESVEE